MGPGQHPRYTRADFGQEAVGGSTTTTRTQATRDARHAASVNNKSGEHRDGWRPKSLVAEHRRWSSEHGQTPVHESVPATWECASHCNMVAELCCESPQHGSGAIVRESPEHGSGAELRTTAVTEPEHARAPITEDGSRTSPTSSLQRTRECQSSRWLGRPTCTRRRTLTQ